VNVAFHMLRAHAEAFRCPALALGIYQASFRLLS